MTNVYNTTRRLTTELTDYPSEEHFAQMKGNATDLLNRVGEMQAMLEKTDLLLGNIGLLLNISQPAVDGKLGIRWWSDGKGKRAPVFVEWKRKKRGDKKFYPVKLDGHITKKQKRHSAFKVNEKPTEEMLNFAVELLRIRSVLTKGLANISRITREIVGCNKDILTFQEKHLRNVGSRIRENNEQWALQKESGLMD